LVIESEAPLLLHGPVDDVVANLDRILAPLKQAGVAYTAECYDVGGKLVRALRWGIR
jgi:hypothetical protein